MEKLSGYLLLNRIQFFFEFGVQLDHRQTKPPTTQFSAQAETPQAEPGQKSAYKENNDEAINNEKLNCIKGEPHT